ncbi:MAG: hypothetical protein JSV86_04515 [Gemmatimonadota bacterium]|nr:MAG: hypothetical protein JSV86_04515 [Gemmatimonadota bacterium]
MTEPQPKKYASEIERRRKPLKDVDSFARARALKALVWLVPAGTALGLALSFFFLHRGDDPLTAAARGFGIGLGAMLLFYGLVYFLVIGGTANLLGRIYFPSSSAPQPPTSWRGQALFSRGSHSEALEAFEEDAARYPDEPGPCLRAAALCLEEMGDPEAAISWYLRARKAGGLAPETDQYISVRLADICESIGEDGRAMVELRRLLERHPDSQYAPGARSRLTALKARQAEADEAEREG